MKIFRLAVCATLALGLMGTSTVGQADEKGVASLFDKNRIRVSQEERVEVVRARCTLSSFDILANSTLTLPNGRPLAVVIESVGQRQPCGSGKFVNVRARVVGDPLNALRFQGQLGIIGNRLFGELADTNPRPGDRNRPYSLVLSGVPVVAAAGSSFKDMFSVGDARLRLVEANRVAVGREAYINTICQCTDNRADVPFKTQGGLTIVGNADPTSGQSAACPAQRIKMLAIEAGGQRFSGEIFYSPLTATFSGILVARNGLRLVLHNLLVPLRGVGCPSGCQNRCGNGICEEITCAAIQCPCPETFKTCPQDCAEGIVDGGGGDFKPMPNPPAGPSNPSGGSSPGPEVTAGTDTNGTGGHRPDVEFAYAPRPCSRNADCSGTFGGGHSGIAQYGPFCCSTNAFPFYGGASTRQCVPRANVEHHSQAGGCMSDGSVGGGDNGNPCADGRCAP